LQPCFENNKVICIRAKWPDIKCSSIIRHKNIFYSKGNPYFSTWNSVKRISPRVSLHYWWDFWRSKSSLQAPISRKCGKRFLCILFLCCDFLVFPVRVWQSLFATYEISGVAQALIFSRLISWKFTKFLERFLCSKLRFLQGSPNVCNISRVAQAPIFARFMKFLAISSTF
jgi:hypothetical protein